MNRYGFVLLLFCGTGCYSLGIRDIFEAPFQPVSSATLASMSDVDHIVRPLRIVSKRSVSAYWDDGRAARGVLLFFDGNGYGAESALRRMLVPARALHLDLVVFNYFDQGQAPPSMSEMRAIGDALYDAARGLPPAGDEGVIIGGHSLGATFALMTAVDRPAAGVFLAAPVTTGVAMIRHQLPVSRLIWLRPDSDYRRFDNLALAPLMRAPTLVIGSDGDESLPPNFTSAVYAAVPSGIRKEQVILHAVPHSGYFAVEAFWRSVAAFFGLPARDSLVGYIR